MVVWLCTFAQFLALGAVAPLLPRFVKDSLGHGDLVVGVVVALVAVSAIGIRPFVGRLVDRRGRRRVMRVGAAISAVSFVLYAVPTLAVVMPARLLTGVGQALFFTGASIAVNELAPGHRRGEAVSYYSIAVYLGFGLGPAVGETVARASTGWGFTAAASLSAVAMLVAARVAETAPRTEATTAWPPSKRISRLALAPGAVLALGMMSNVAFASFMPLYADELGMSGAAGVYLAYTVVVIGVRLFGARLPDVLGTARAGTAAGVLIAAGMATMAAFGTVWSLYVGAVTLASGLSFLYPSLMKLVADRSPAHEASSAVATFTMFLDISTGLGGMAAGAAAAIGGYQSAFATASVAALCGLAVLRLVVLRAPAPT